MYTISQITTIIQAKALSVHNNNTLVEHLTIDSRIINFSSNSLFFAFSSSTRDGHQYVQDSYNKGVRMFVVSKKIPTKQLPDCTILLVKNVLTALQQIAIHHRQQFKTEVIGITGSNGKTIVKEWLNQLLQPEFTIIRSPKSYNSQIGVALSVWQLQQQHNLAIFEAGVSEPNQMQALQAMIQPNIGILTNIGEPHNEGFKNNYSQKFIEKILLFKNCTTIIYNANDLSIHQKIQFEFSLKSNLVS